MKVLYEFLSKEGKPVPTGPHSRSLKLSRLAFVPAPLLSFFAWVCANSKLTHLNQAEDSRTLAGAILFAAVLGPPVGAMTGLVITAVAGLRGGPGRRLRVASWILNGTFLAITAYFLFRLKR